MELYTFQECEELVSKLETRKGLAISMYCIRERAASFQHVVSEAFTKLKERLFQCYYVNKTVELKRLMQILAQRIRQLSLREVDCLIIFCGIMKTDGEEEIIDIGFQPPMKGLEVNECHIEDHFVTKPLEDIIEIERSNHKIKSARK